MRVPFTSTPSYSHVHPLVPFARALAEAGHEVAFATGASFAPVVAHTGFRHVPAGFDGGSVGTPGGREAADPSVVNRRFAS
jgi:UDP:flavonoid glycosyltransferase YjiC (YdhE family)